MPDYTVDTTTPVMVTGATGYVAGWIVKGLLEAGATVHAPVRNPDDPGKTADLQALADASPGTIRFFKADLLDQGSYAEAMAGCGIVFHTASPFFLNVKNPQKDLIDPALDGTRNVLNEASRTPSVKRVVLTSSCVAMYTDNTDCASEPGGRITEDSWNRTASLSYEPYSYSKTLAERAAWELHDAQSQWKLVVINPHFVLGPAVWGQPTSESFSLVRQMGDGTFKSGAPRFGTGLVDVREIATAHLAAAYLPQAEGRHIVNGYETDLYEIAATLRAKFGADYALPQRVAPKWLVWLIAPMIGLSRKRVTRNVNVPFRGDNRKSIEQLGITYRPMSETMEDMFQQMIDAGTFKDNQ